MINITTLIHVGIAASTQQFQFAHDLFVIQGFYGSYRYAVYFQSAFKTHPPELYVTGYGFRLTDKSQSCAEIDV